MSKKIPVAPTRQIAIELGLSRYKAKKPCKYGHMAERSTKSGNCIECLQTIHKEKINESIKKYRDNNSDYLKKKKFHKMNRTRLKAINSRSGWTHDQISVVLRKKSNGDYALTASRLGEILGRSQMAIEDMRTKHKPRGTI